MTTILQAYNEDKLTYEVLFNKQSVESSTKKVEPKKAMPKLKAPPPIIIEAKKDNISSNNAEIIQNDPINIVNAPEFINNESNQNGNIEIIHSAVQSMLLNRLQL